MTRQAKDQDDPVGQICEFTSKPTKANGFRVSKIDVGLSTDYEASGRHLGSANILFGDGHAGSLKYTGPPAAKGYSKGDPVYLRWNSEW